MDLVELSDQTILFSLLVFEKITPILRHKFRKDLTINEFYTLLLVNYSGELKMTDFAYDLGIKKQQATRVVNSLVKKGFIKRSYEKVDRRIVRIGLTPYAEAYLDDYIKKTSILIDDSLKGLSESEIIKFQNALETINKVLPKMKV